MCVTCYRFFQTDWLSAHFLPGAQSEGICQHTVKPTCRIFNSQPKSQHEILS